jgi:hypothetical protein
MQDLRNSTELFRSGNAEAALGKVPEKHRIEALDTLGDILSDSEEIGDHPLTQKVLNNIDAHHMVTSPLYKGSRKVSDSFNQLNKSIHALNKQFPDIMHNYWSGWRWKMGRNIREGARDLRPNAPQAHVDQGPIPTGPPANENEPQ